MQSITRKDKTIFLVKLSKGRSVSEVIPLPIPFFEGCSKSLRGEILLVWLFSCRDTPTSPALGRTSSSTLRPMHQLEMEIRNFKRPKVYINTQPWGIFMVWRASSWGLRECHRIQLQWEYVTGAVWAHKAPIREPVHVFNSEPFITFNTKGSFL